ncbi:uncharacterized protein LOC143034511 [Oratosquilla oratoria]|uniref:uncharacterized protein LOC143034511 n=1 Tax=Oratosquilla oratoria TaxID=337810 RepID=UPI003F773657
MKILSCCVFLLVLSGALGNAGRDLSSGGSIDDSINIDGKGVTIGITVAKFLAGLLPESCSKVIIAIIDVLAPVVDTEVDYFELIKEDVKQVVGDYINDHNMQQLEIYKSDLAVLLNRYNEAPTESSTYPDKNTVANSLSTSMMANRYLVEAVERPQSMILHYTDIASIHILVLKDVAETYSNEVLSRWWVDLDEQLAHYIDYAHKLQNRIVDWRNDMVTCVFKPASSVCVDWEWAGTTCYDTWTVDDPVVHVRDTCMTLHNDDRCNDHCQAYQMHMNREVAQWIWEYLGKAMKQWKKLKITSSAMANFASRSYKP